MPVLARISAAGFSAKEMGFSSDQRFLTPRTSGAAMKTGVASVNRSMDRAADGLPHVSWSEPRLRKSMWPFVDIFPPFLLSVFLFALRKLWFIVHSPKLIKPVVAVVVWLLPCSLVGGCTLFDRICCLRLQCGSEVKGSGFFRNVDNYLYIRLRGVGAHETTIYVSFCCAEDLELLYSWFTLFISERNLFCPPTPLYIFLFSC
jgi:hypothetical protein